MKKFIFPLIAAALTMGFVSCVNEEKDLFDGSAAERLNEASAKYTAALSADGGTYVMEYWPTYYSESPFGAMGPSSKGYLMCLQFNANGSVRVGMNNEYTHNQYREATSVWEVITDMGAVLSFNTYNENLHTFSTPESSVNGVYTGDQAYGVSGDYEFIVTEIAKDGQHVMLKGKKNGTYSRLTRLPEGTNFEDYLADINNFVNTTLPSSMKNYLLMTVGKTVYKSEDWNTTNPNIYTFTSTAELDERRQPYLITKQGDEYHMRFRSAVHGMEESAEAFVSDLVFDPNTGCFNSWIAGESGKITGLVDEDMPEFLRVSMNNSTNWTFLPTEGSMSDSVKVVIDKLLEGTKVSKSTYKLDPDKGISFLSTDYGQTVNLTISMRSSTAMPFVYVFSGSNTDKGFAYTDTQTTAGKNATLAKNYRSTIDGIEELIQIFGSEFRAERCDTGLNVTKMKMVRVDNPDIWFIVSM